MRIWGRFLALNFLPFIFALAVHAQPAALTITTEPNAIVWIDEVRRGTTDASGKLTLNKLSPGRHTVRVRANSFKEATATLLPGRKTLVVKLVGTSDPRELMFQQAEKAREEARDDASRENAVELYRGLKPVRFTNRAAERSDCVISETLFAIDAPFDF